MIFFWYRRRDMDSLFFLLTATIWIFFFGQPSLGETGNPQEKLSSSETIHLFDDFLCEHCESYANNEFVTFRYSKIQKKKNVPIIWHFYEINKDSRPLAIATYCAFEQGQKNGWDMHDALFHTPSQERTKKKTKRIAQHYKMDIDAWETCLISPETEQKLQNDEILATKWGIISTPTTRIGGKNFPGRVPLENLIWERERVLSEKGQL